MQCNGLCNVTILMRAKLEYDSSAFFINTRLPKSVAEHFRNPSTFHIDTFFRPMYLIVLKYVSEMVKIRGLGVGDRPLISVLGLRGLFGFALLGPASCEI